MSAPLAAFQGSIEDVANPTLLGATRSRVVGVIAADAAGRLRPSAASILQAVRLMATAMRAELVTLLIAPAEESLQRQVVAQCLALGRWDIVLLTTSASASSGEIGGQMLVDCWPDPVAPPRAIVGESWTEMAFAALAGRQRKSEMLALRIRQVKMDQGKIILVSSRAGGKLQTQFTLDLRSGAAPWISLIDVAEIAPAPETNLPRTVDGSAGPPVVQRWAARPVSAKTDVWEGLLAEVKQELGVARLADADFIVDVGFGVGNRDGYEAVIDPLLQSLQELGVRSLAIGGSRKVTEELHLLSADRQIGQTGVSVNPHILLAIGISGAPQHLNYIGPRATILAFNRDSEAPIMTLNRRQASPRVFPIIGDLFETVPAFIAALGKETPISSN